MAEPQRFEVLPGGRMVPEGSNDPKLEQNHPAVYVITKVVALICAVFAWPMFAGFAVAIGTYGWHVPVFLFFFVFGLTVAIFILALVYLLDD